jgi:hypothetical protein
MRVSINPSSVKIWLSANDTYNWAHKSGASWPGSQLSGCRLFAEFDSNGLLDLAIDGRSDTDCDGNELSAICADHLARKLPREHPAYNGSVGS